MTEFPIKGIVSPEDLEWFSHCCIMIGISDLRAIKNHAIDEEDLDRLHKIMNALANE